MLMKMFLKHFLHIFAVAEKAGDFFDKVRIEPVSAGGIVQAVADHIADNEQSIGEYGIDHPNRSQKAGNDRNHRSLENDDRKNYFIAIMPDKRKQVIDRCGHLSIMPIFLGFE